MSVMASEEYFHMNSAACWMLLLLGGGVLAVAAFVLYCKGKGAFAALCVLGIVGTGFGSYFMWSAVDASADTRDRYVVAALNKGGVTFEDFLDNDTERIRVSRMVEGKKCSASFDVVLGDYEGRWPLQRGTGRNASGECGVDDVENTSGLYEDGEGARSYYLDQIFKPANGEQFRLAG